MVRRFSSHEWLKYRDLRLRALAESPDAFGSTLAQEQGLPDAAWSTRLTSAATSSSELPLLAEIGAKPVGLAWARVDSSEPELVHLYQMWVDPTARGAGIGRMLLDAAITWATGASARFLRLSVACGNSPAARLYARSGFTPVGNLEPIRPGSTLLVQPLQLELRAA
jgi:ribosomal protein S18 acetylase RimI-like enzyme